MKRIIALLMLVLITFSLCASTSVAALPSPTGVSYYMINVEIKGHGGVTTSDWKVVANEGNIVTLTATESDSPFVFWNLKGDFELVDGMQTDKVLTIRPLSDILTIATFEDGLDEVAVTENRDISPTSPKTGQDALPVYIILMVMVVAAVGIFYGTKQIKYKRNFNRL